MVITNESMKTNLYPGQVKIYSFFFAVFFMLACTEEVGTNENKGQIQLPPEQAESASEIDAESDCITSVTGDFNQDGKIEIATVEERDSLLWFCIYDADMEVVLANENVIFNRNKISSEDIHYMVISFDAISKSIMVMQESFSVRPDGFYLAWLSYRDELYKVDSIAYDMKVYLPNRIDLKGMSKIMDKPLEGSNLIKEFGELSLKSYELYGKDQ